MRIAQVSTLATPVRQTGAGSIEALVWLLARELTNLGHDITIFAASGSQAPGEVVATLPGTYAAGGSPDNWQLCEWINLARAVEESSRFDIIHSHAYLWGLPLESLSRAPMVHTLHVSPEPDSARIRSIYPQACVTGISRFQWSAYPEMPPAAVIQHGVDASQFSFREVPDDYLCYLGRFTPGKGPLDAIAAAQSLGIPIKMAGPRNEYFSHIIEPLLQPGAVEYVGPIGGAKRDRLLGGARALVYPLCEAEPFGLVLAEAMMCGTPVAAYRLGAVPELVEEGVTGCSVEPGSDIAQAVASALQLNRYEVRARALARFSAARMAEEYAALYAHLHSRAQRSPSRDAA